MIDTAQTDLVPSCGPVVEPLTEKFIPNGLLGSSAKDQCALQVTEHRVSGFLSGMVKIIGLSILTTFREGTSTLDRFVSNGLLSKSKPTIQLREMSVESPRDNPSPKSLTPAPDGLLSSPQGSTSNPPKMLL